MSHLWLNRVAVFAVLFWFGALTAHANELPADLSVILNEYKRAIENGDKAAHGQSLLKIAELGHPESQARIAIAYSQGLLGRSVSKSEAAKWFLRAAQQGEPMGQCNINSHYFQGEGIEENFKEAYKWSELCLRNPPTTTHKAKAVMIIEALHSLMSAAEMTEARRSVYFWSVQKER